MKSRITIEVDFDNGNMPVIQILQYPQSDDVRDKLIKYFTELMGGSSWCRLSWKEGGDDFNRIHICPIHATHLKEQVPLMIAEVERYEAWKNNRADKDIPISESQSSISEQMKEIWK